MPSKTRRSTLQSPSHSLVVDPKERKDSFIRAGGAASNGTQPIMDLQATELHQRTPLFIGSKDDVATLEQFARGERA